MNGELQGALQRIERQAQNPVSKIAQADDGSFSWPALDDQSVVLYPLGYLDAVPSRGILLAIGSDEVLTTCRVYVFDERTLLRAMATARPVEEVDTESLNFKHQLVSSAVQDPTNGTPNDEDRDDFIRLLFAQ